MYFFYSHGNYPAVVNRVKLHPSRFALLGLGIRLFFRHADVARQVAANQRAVTESAQATADDRGEDRHQEVRDVACAGEGDFAPAGR